jgi:tetratricopeptide (TPR) repeat protein
MNKHQWVISLGASILCLGAIGSASSAAPVDRPAIGSAYSAPALYNLGNYYARAGRPAMAVLNYERALILAPTDPDIQKNLSHVRESAGLPALHSGWLNQHDRLANPNTLYWIGVLGLALTGGTLLLRRPHSKHRTLLAGGAVVGGLMMALSLGDAIATAPTLHEYVVMAATPARSSPTSAVEPLFTAPLADVVNVRDEHQGFALIRDTQGREGWVARNDLSPVIPSPHTVP